MSALVYLIGESEASCLDCEIRSELVLVQASRAQTRLSHSEKPYIEFKNDMTEQEFLLLAKAKYSEISELKKQPTLLDYEQGFVEIWQELGRQVLQADLGYPGRDRRKKRNIKPPSEPSK